MKKTIATILIPSFLLFSCGKEEVITSEDDTNIKYVSVEKIKPKYFSEELKISGKISSNKETIVSPLANGTIKSINVQVGDNVKAGDLLATIDTQSNLSNITLNNAANNYQNTLGIYDNTITSLKADIETSKLQYENAVSSRDNTYKTTQKQLELAQSQLDTILKQKDNANNTTKTSLLLSSESLNNAKLNLENFEKTSAETLKSLDTQRKTIEDKKNGVVNTLRTTIDTAFVTIDSSLTDVDKLLGVSDLNKKFNDNYEIYLSAKDNQYKKDAELLFNSSKNSFDNVRKNYSKDLSNDEVVKYYKNLLDITDELVSLYEKVIQVLDNSVTSDTFTETNLSTIRGNIKSSQNYVLTLKSNLVNLNNSLSDIDNSLSSTDNTISSTKTQLDTQRATLNQALSTAKVSLDNTKASTDTSLDNLNSSELTQRLQIESTIENINASRTSADNSVKIAEQQYNSAKLKYNSSMLSTKSQLDNAKGSKDQASQQINNAQIKAPFDGIITSKNIEIGTAVSSQTQAFGIANNLDKIVKLELSSDNIKYLQIGKEVNIDKNGVTGTGIISMVSSSADEKTKMYKVEVMFGDNNFSKDLVLGDFIDVYIKKEHNENKYLIIPFSSLLAGSNGNYSVYLVGTGNIIEERKVKIGESNSHEVIIKDGLKENDTVVVSGSLNVEIGDKVKLK